MERRVKERLIGASILVVLIVLVVPELLSGPKSSSPVQAMLPAVPSEPVRNVTVDLSTSKPPLDSEAESPDAPRAASATTPDPGTASPGIASSRPAAPIAAAPGPPAAPANGHADKIPTAKAAAVKSMPARSSQLETASFSPISSTRAWSVQLGSFANRANAENLSRQLKGQGYSVYVVAGGSGSSARYRVRVGPLADRQSAERMAARLKSQGRVSSLVAPAA